MLTISNKVGNNIELTHINVECLCEKCGKIIDAGKYHFYVHLNFKYYGRKSIKFAEKTKRNCLGTVRLHFECFDAISNDLIQLNEELKKLKAELVVKRL